MTVLVNSLGADYPTFQTFQRMLREYERNGDNPLVPKYLDEDGQPIPVITESPAATSSVNAFGGVVRWGTIGSFTLGNPPQKPAPPPAPPPKRWAAVGGTWTPTAVVDASASQWAHSIQGPEQLDVTYQCQRCHLWFSGGHDARCEGHDR